MIPNVKQSYNIMKKAGIHIQLLAAAVLLITVTTVTLRYLAVKMIHQFVQLRFDERMHFLAKYLALNAELGILIDERVMLKRLAENLLSEKDVICVRIEDSSHQILTEVSKQLSGPVSVIEAPVMSRQYPDESDLHELSDRKEEQIGKVEITYSVEGIYTLLDTIKQYFFWLSAVLAGISVIIFYLISRSVAAPITRLVHAARKVAEGDLSLRVAPGALPETRELSLAFNVMLESLQQSREALENAQKEMFRQKTLAEMGKFSMMIAHELKNPLSIIKSSLDVLKHDESSKQLMIEYMDDEIKRLNRLIEDFLMFAKPVVPVFHLTDASSLIADIAAKFELTSGNGAAIRLIDSGLPCMIECDEDLLKRTIENIIKNAIEATGGSGAVEIVTESDDLVWKVLVKDQGQGVPDQLKSKIFEPFFTTRSKGTGLGLAYAAQVVSAHNGRISVKDQDQGGAVFIVEIPKKAANSIR